MKSVLNMNLSIARRMLILSSLLASMPTIAMAQSSDELKAQEQWLRYSNWEHRSSRPRPFKPSSTPPASSQAQDLSNSQKPASTSSEPAMQTPFFPSKFSPKWAQAQDAVIPLPDRPGSQTVDSPQQFAVPGWAFQQPQQPQRPIEIMMGPSAFAGPSFRSQLGYGGYGGGFMGGLAPFGGAFMGSGCGRGFRQSPLGPGVMQIQTGPSPASGNYYQPSTADPSASGGYYASGAPWQVPLNSTGNDPKDYWGPMGNPFK